MGAPLTTDVALTFGFAGIVAVLIAYVLPRRPSVPRDWDPYRWRLYLQRIWPEESFWSQFCRVLHAIGHRWFTRFASSKALADVANSIAHAIARSQWTLGATSATTRTAHGEQET